MIPSGEKVGQEQIHRLLFEDKLSWQSIIYDLINSEQLDPWNIDISLLAQKYLEKMRELEEANFLVSSKVLLAASLLLRIKSEIVLSYDIPALDDILFGSKEKKLYKQERIELDEDIPMLVPRTPLPRFRRVSLDELMAALGKAIQTETRRIRREVLVKQHEREVQAVLPNRFFNLKDKIDEIYHKLLNVFSNHSGKIGFSGFVSDSSKEELVASFVSLLHLDNQQRIWLEQEGHLEEIWIWLKEHYEISHSEELSKKRAEVEAFMREAEKEQEASDLSFSAEDGEFIEDEAPQMRTESGFGHEDEL